MPLMLFFYQIYKLELSEQIYMTSGNYQTQTHILSIKQGCQNIWNPTVREFSHKNLKKPRIWEKKLPKNLIRVFISKPSSKWNSNKISLRYKTFIK